MVYREGQIWYSKAWRPPLSTVPPVVCSLPWWYKYLRYPQCPSEHEDEGLRTNISQIRGFWMLVYIFKSDAFDRADFSLWSLQSKCNNNFKMWKTIIMTVIFRGKIWPEFIIEIIVITFFYNEEVFSLPLCFTVCVTIILRRDKFVWEDNLHLLMGVVCLEPASRAHPSKCTNI